jgi:cytochrome c oxidase subunit II
VRTKQIESNGRPEASHMSRTGSASPRRVHRIFLDPIAAAVASKNVLTQNHMKFTIRKHGARALRLIIPLLSVCAPRLAWGDMPRQIPSIFAPESTPADSIFHLSLFVLAITGGIFVVVAGLLTWALIRYRARGDDTSEPPQIYGSTQVELAWTVVPILIVVVLFLTTARIIFAIQDAPKPKSALDVTVVGHQFWWEFRYPKLGIVTANELHVPVGSATFLHLLSADVMHSFWVPQLAGKTDVIPNHPNETWIEPQRTGLYLGQCAQFCGIEHAKMLLRVYVDTPAQFAAWVKDQQQAGIQDPQVAAGRQIFETHACTNCHAIAGTAAAGRFGPDLTHLASRATIASGAVPNTPANLREWIKDPDHFKEGVLMPAMQLNDSDIDELVAYLDSLH